jgi:hypothetical protein
MERNCQQQEKKQKEAPKKYVTEWLADHQDSKVRVKFTNGRQGMYLTVFLADDNILTRLK